MLWAVLTLLRGQILTSATTLGALFGGFGSGLLADLIGRKAVIAIADVVFIVGAGTWLLSRVTPSGD